MEFKDGIIAILLILLFGKCSKKQVDEEKKVTLVTTKQSPPGIKKDTVDIEEVERRTDKNKNYK